MNYNRFLVNTFLRVLFIVVNIFLISYLSGLEKRAFTIVLFGGILIYQVFELHRYVSRTNRDLAKFLFYLKYGDTSLNFSTAQIEKIFKNLNLSFNEIIQDIQLVKNEKEIQSNFLETTVNHVGVGIISYNKDFKIHLFNKKAASLLQLSALVNLSDLEKVQKGLFYQIKNINPGQPLIIKLKHKNGIQHLSFNSIISKTGHEEITLLSFQNIKNELEENELLSYQKLIRVMNHEMMNSLTPITTLTTSIKRSLSENSHIKPVEKLDQETINDAYTSSELIEERSKGLIDYIQKHRKLTSLPQPNFKMCLVEKLFKKTTELLSSDIKDQQIEIKYETINPNIEILIDENLLSQVLINLVKNAMEALDHNLSKEITLTAQQTIEGKVLIQVNDNGKGIEEDLMDDIFVPFFTTKEYGSGIGLSFCRQVMRMHNGNISVKSKKGEGSTFTLEFI